MRRALPIVLVVLCAGIAAGCDGDSSESQKTDTTTTVDETTRGAVYLLRDGKVSPVEREMQSRDDVDRAALLKLLEGPTADESADGLTSDIPEGTELLDYSVEDGVATVDLNGVFAEGGDDAPSARRVAQVVATVTRYRDVRRVAFEIDGERVESIGNVHVAPSIGRRAIEEQTPQILVEYPLPEDDVRSPIRLRGTANVFEATVSIEVRGDDGKVLLETFTTATSGTGTRGTFSKDLRLPEASGDVTIVAFEASAEDGTPLHVVEVPVTVTD